MSVPRYLVEGTVLDDGSLLAVGGTYGEDGTLAGAEAYDAVGGSWTSAGSMTDARLAHTVTLLPETGQVLVIGGADNLSVHASAELYTPATLASVDAGSGFGSQTIGTSSALSREGHQHRWDAVAHRGRGCRRSRRCGLRGHR